MSTVYTRPLAVYLRFEGRDEHKLGTVLADEDGYVDPDAAVVFLQTVAGHWQNYLVTCRTRQGADT